MSKKGRTIKRPHWKRIAKRAKAKLKEFKKNGGQHPELLTRAQQVPPPTPEERIAELEGQLKRFAAERDVRWAKERVVRPLVATIEALIERN